jgi:hypothetical protein
MNTKLSPFSRWALDEERTADERYMIWLICESARLQEHWLLAATHPGRVIQMAPPHYQRELFYNPGLVPSYGAEETETAARMIPHLKKFPLTSVTGYETRPMRDAGALRWFPAMEELNLTMTELSDVSVLRELPELRVLALSSGELTDLSPLRECGGLRVLKLGLIGPGHPALAPPVHWLDASPLSELQALEELDIYPNAAVLRGMCFPKVGRATLVTGSVVQADCGFLPDMPALRQLKLDGVQSLQGIARFRELRSLEVAGPLRDWGDIAELPHLMCLEVNTHCGWPRNVAPLAAAPELRWVRFGGEMPRNYWPLAGAPKLCALEAHQAKAITLDVEAINAALTPWDKVFACTPPRVLPPLRFVSADPRAIPQPGPEPDPDYVDCPAVFLQELQWMYRRAMKMVDALVDEDGAMSGGYAPSGTCMHRHLQTGISSQAAADRLPEVIEALRQAMAASPHQWYFSFAICLTVPRHKWGPDRQQWWDKLQAGWRSEEDEEESLRKWQLQQKHIIESNFRKRTAEEEGEAPDPEDLEPPEEIRPRPYQPPVTVPADPDAQKEKDFALKPFDEQDQNDGDDDAEGGAAVDTDDDPPNWFLEDPNGHPLADSYRLYGALTLDTFYVWHNLLPTAEMLMGRGADETLMAPPKL